jgi:hypothetical protein
MRKLEASMSILIRIFQAMLVNRKLLQSIQDQLQQIIDLLTPGPAVKIIFTAHLADGTTQTGVEMFTFRDDQQVGLTIQPVDAKGKPAPVDGLPVWASSDETIITVAAAPDGMSAVAAAVAPGVARIAVTADADMGSGVAAITGTLDVTVTPGGAISINILPGEPTVPG